MIFRGGSARSTRNFPISRIKKCGRLNGGRVITSTVHDLSGMIDPQSQNNNPANQNHTMAKSQNSKKQTMKAPLKTPDQKRADKRAKKNAS